MKKDWRKLPTNKLRDLLDIIYHTVRGKNYSNKIACVCQAFGYEERPSKCGGQYSYSYQEGGFNFILTCHLNPQCEPTVRVEDKDEKRYYYVAEKRGKIDPFASEPERPQYIIGEWEKILNRKFMEAIKSLGTNSWIYYHEKKALIKEIEDLNYDED